MGVVCRLSGNPSLFGKWAVYNWNQRADILLDYEVLTLRHFEKLSNGQPAHVLGVQKSAASNRYVRALKRLRKVLSGIPEFFDP
jgi:hypothetical protein